MQRKSSEEQKEQKKRNHPLLPTPHEAQASPELVYSDHLPVRVKLPVYPTDELNVVTWNVFDDQLGDFAYGFKIPKHNEPRSLTSAEHCKQITGALQKMFTARTADIIVMQEVSQELLAALETMTSAAGCPFSLVKGDPNSGRHMLYNKQNLQLIGEAKDDFKNSALNARFSINGRTFSISDVHIPHENVPLNTEDTVTKLVSTNKEKFPDDANHLIIGDFNSRIAPTWRGNNLIITGVCPATFREEQGQGIDWTDGGFCLSSNGFIHQMESELINPESGKVCAWPAADRSIFEGCTQFQNQELREFRISMCVADEFNHGNDFSGQRSIFTFQKDLREQLSDNSILVRSGANALNEKAFCITTRNSRDMVSKAQALLGGFGAQTKFFEPVGSEMQPTLMLSIPQPHARDLELALDLIINEQHYTNAAINNLAPKLKLSTLFKASPGKQLSAALHEFIQSPNTGADASLITLYAMLISSNENVKAAVSEAFPEHPIELLQKMYSGRINALDRSGNVAEKLGPLVDAINNTDAGAIKNLIRDLAPAKAMKNE